MHFWSCWGTIIEEGMLFHNVIEPILHEVMLKFVERFQTLLFFICSYLSKYIHLDVSSHLRKRSFNGSVYMPRYLYKHIGFKCNEIRFEIILSLCKSSFKHAKRYKLMQDIRNRPRFAEITNWLVLNLFIPSTSSFCKKSPSTWR